MSLLSRFTIRTKLFSIVSVSAIAVCTVIAVAASLSKQRMADDRVIQLRTAVDTMLGMVESLQDDVTAGKLTIADAENQFRVRARRMMFDKGQGYAVAYRTTDQAVMMNAAIPKLDNTVTGSKDANGTLISQEVIDAARQSPEGGSVTYYYPRPGQTVPVRKMTYARPFTPWNMVLGVGLYVDDLDNDFNALLIRLSVIGGIVLILTCLLSWLISRDILGALQRQQRRMHSIATGSLDTKVEESDRGDEIGRMAETLEMLRQTSLTARSLETKQASLKQMSETEKRDALIALANRFDALVGLMAAAPPNWRRPRSP